MKLIFSNWIWTYNFCDSKEKSFYAKVSIVEDDGTQILDWVNNPVIEYSIKEEDSRYWLEDEQSDYFQMRNSFDIQELFEKSYKYISGMWSTKDYMGNLLLFEKLFTENYESISRNFSTVRNQEIEKDIAQLRSQIIEEWDIPDLPDLNGKEREIKKIQDSIAYHEKDLSQYKEWTEWYLKAEKRIQEYTEKLNKL